MARQTIDPRTASEYLMYVVTRIEADDSVGTGFFYKHTLDNGAEYPYLVTNKHVIAGCNSYSLNLNTRISGRKESAIADGGFIEFTSQKNSKGSGGDLDWLLHPDPFIDLAILPMAPILQIMESEKVNFMISFVNGINNLPVNVPLSMIEDIIMVGFPNGLWDETNKFPLFRKGITSTHPSIDFNGKEEFVIDAACFPGSSGSPVFKFREGIWSDGTQPYHGDYVQLLGILYAGPQFQVSGEMRIVDIPTSRVEVPVMNNMLHLGYVIKAEVLYKWCDQISKNDLEE